MCKKVKYFLALLLVSFIIKVQAQPILETLTIKNIELGNFKIRGETNVNKFDIRYFGEDATNKQFCFNNMDPCENYLITIPIDKLQYSNYLMRNDFLSLVKVDQYPTIKIELNLDNVKFIDHKHRIDISDIIISLAGVRSHYNLHCFLQKQSNTKYILLGDQKINLSDFNLTPPEKFMGMVKVKDEVFISFDLKLDIEDN